MEFRNFKLHFSEISGEGGGLQLTQSPKNTPLVFYILEFIFFFYIIQYITYVFNYYLNTPWLQCTVQVLRLCVITTQIAQ